MEAFARNAKSELESVCEKLAEWGEAEISLAQQMTAHHLKAKNVLERKVEWMQNKVKRQNQSITRLVNQCAVTEAHEALRMPRRVLIFSRGGDQPLASRFVCLSPDESTLLILDEKANAQNAKQGIKVSSLTEVSLGVRSPTFRLHCFGSTQQAQLRHYYNLPQSPTDTSDTYHLPSWAVVHVVAGGEQWSMVCKDRRDACMLALGLRHLGVEKGAKALTPRTRAGFMWDVFRLRLVTRARELRKPKFTILVQALREVKAIIFSESDRGVLTPEASSGFIGDQLSVELRQLVCKKQLAKNLADIFKVHSPQLLSKVKILKESLWPAPEAAVRALGLRCEMRKLVRSRLVPKLVGALTQGSGAHSPRSPRISPKNASWVDKSPTDFDSSTSPKTRPDAFLRRAASDMEGHRSMGVQSDVQDAHMDGQFETRARSHSDSGMTLELGVGRGRGRGRGTPASMPHEVALRIARRRAQRLSQVLREKGKDGPLFIKASHRYQPTPENAAEELHFEKNEILRVDPVPVQDGWLMAVRPSNMERGLVPANYFSVTDQAVSGPTKHSSAQTLRFPACVSMVPSPPNQQFVPLLPGPRGPLEMIPRAECTAVVFDPELRLYVSSGDSGIHARRGMFFLRVTVPVATKSLGIRCSYEADPDHANKLLVQDVDPRGPIGQTQNIRAGDEIVMVQGTHILERSEPLAQLKNACQNRPLTIVFKLRMPPSYSVRLPPGVTCGHPLVQGVYRRTNSVYQNAPVYRNEHGIELSRNLIGDAGQLAWVLGRTPDPYFLQCTDAFRPLLHHWERVGDAAVNPRANENLALTQQSLRRGAKLECCALFVDPVKDKPKTKLTSAMRPARTQSPARVRMTFNDSSTLQLLGYESSSESKDADSSSTVSESSEDEYPGNDRPAFVTTSKRHTTAMKSKRKNSAAHRSSESELELEAPEFNATPKSSKPCNVEGLTPKEKMLCEQRWDWWSSRHGSATDEPPRGTTHAMLQKKCKSLVKLLGITYSDISVFGVLFDRLLISSARVSHRRSTSGGKHPRVSAGMVATCMSEFGVHASVLRYIYRAVALEIHDPLRTVGWTAFVILMQLVSLQASGIPIRTFRRLDMEHCFDFEGLARWVSSRSGSKDGERDDVIGRCGDRSKLFAGACGTVF